MEEKFYLEEEQKEEKNCPLKTNFKMIKFKSLNRNIQFLNILKKRRLNTKYFTIYFDKNSDYKANKIPKYLNISFITKKKVGNAVIRNKIKRRLKSAMQKIINDKKIVDLNYTYVIFGRNSVHKDKFPLVLNEINNTFEKIRRIDK